MTLSKLNIQAPRKLSTNSKKGRILKKKTQPFGRLIHLDYTLVREKRFFERGVGKVEQFKRFGFLRYS